MNTIIKILTTLFLVGFIIFSIWVPLLVFEGFLNPGFDVNYCSIADTVAITELVIKYIISSSVAIGIVGVFLMVFCVQMKIETRSSDKNKS